MSRISDLSEVDVIDGMRVWAKGSMSDMAAVEILTDSPPITRRWITDGGFRSCLTDCGAGRLGVDWEKVRELAERSPASSGEIALLRLAAAVGGELIDDLGANLLCIGGTAGATTARAVEYLAGARKSVY